MPNAFNFAASPFDCLTPTEKQLVRDNVDIAYFPEGEVILNEDSKPTHLFVIIKGYVTQFDGKETVTTYGPEDCFDGRSLMAGKVSSRFVATEEVVAYELKRAAVSELIASNATFGALLFSDLSAKLSALSERQNQHEMKALTMARVDEAFLRPPHFVEAKSDIVSVVRVFREQRTSSVFVQDKSTQPERLGIFTATALQRAILDGRPLDQIEVGSLTNYSLIEVKPSDQLGDAMAMMLKRRVHRVVVRDGEKIIGMLEALDMFSFLSNQSHLITVRIEEATDLEGLSQAAAQITRMIMLLYRGGSRINLIAQLVQQLNARLFERAWNLIAPPDLVANSCLFVMGSEGRGEQLLKTDQDNSLILRDAFVAPSDLEAICQRFSNALASFGYPLCPGNIMVSNPMWRKSASEFADMAKGWLLQPNADNLMNLAIFMDAHAVCGDSKLLLQVQNELSKLATDNEPMLARFASAIDAFGSSSGWWNRLLSLGDASQQLHLKKEGIFPLVHGVRSLALANRLSETNTIERISALVAKGKMTAQMGADLTDSLYFFMSLKLKAGLAEMDTDKLVTGSVDVAKLTSLDRDLLKDALAVVKRFRMGLRQQFHLDSI